MKDKLMTLSYFHEIEKHLVLSNVNVSDVWCARRKKGAFKKFILSCYEKKQLPELKGTMDRESIKE